MSTIRYFDSVPHIVRYGMQDEKKGKSWMLFYRSATCFRVSVSREDVGDTAFGMKWLDLNKEHPHPRPVGMKKNWVEQWNELCDCIITQCMPVLQELAPLDRQWKTLEDHLRTPTYNLKMVADREVGDAVAAVTSGPDEKPSYEHHLVPFSELKMLPQGIHRYRAPDLTVMGQGKDWRHPPAKVRTPTGDEFYFMACNKRAKNASTGIVSNASANKIHAYSRLYTVLDGTSGVNIPKLLGVVVSNADEEGEDWDLEGNRLATQEGSAKAGDASLLVAGVLLTNVSKARTLAHMKESIANKAETTDVKGRWKTQITAAIQHLHAHGIAVGGRSDPEIPWFFINQHTVYIAPVNDPKQSDATGSASFEAADAWLMVEASCTIFPADGQQTEQEKEEFEMQKAMDLEAVEKLFEF